MTAFGRMVHTPKVFWAGLLSTVIAAILMALWLLFHLSFPWAVTATSVGVAGGAVIISSIFETRRDRFLAFALAVAVGAAMLVTIPRAARGYVLGHRYGVVRKSIGHPAPDFTLPDLDGKVVRLSDLRGKVVVVDVWRTWCGPCRAEMPYLSLAYPLLGPEGLVVLGLSDEPPAKQAVVRKEYGVPFPLLVTGSTLPAPYRSVHGFPTTFLVGRDGRIVEVDFGRRETGLRRLAREVRGLPADPPLEELLPDLYPPPATTSR